VNRKEFGQLIASLRQDLGLTQAQLAEQIDLENATLSNIERGAKRHIEPETLFRLANALQLTSLERREFFLGACGLEQEKIVRQPGPGSKTKVFDADKVLAELFDQMGKIYLPANLGDCYGDLIAVNKALLGVLQIDADALKSMSEAIGGFNNLHYVYGSLLSQQALGNEFSQSALDAIRAFREGSLRYRSKPRYRELMREFRNPQRYPLFERYWRRVSTLDDDKESAGDRMQFQHPRYGTLSLMISSQVTVTPYGELFLSYFLPMDAHTATSLTSLVAETGQEVIPLLSWPEKKPLVK
jgi:transcriptional regulator with XRE-family HTH domain